LLWILVRGLIGMMLTENLYSHRGEITQNS
jgi:hypothetical protein